MLKILRIEENKYRNIYVISDIHAHGNLLEKLLEKIEYSKEDLFLILGDSCDRGSELEKTYEILFKLQKESNLMHLIGNHEKMLEDYYMGIERETYLINENGSKKTRVILDNNEDLKDKILDFIYEMPHIIYSENYIFVHAGIDKKISLENQNEKYILWTRDRFWLDKDNENKKMIIFGHKVQEYGIIKIDNFYNYIGMDCGTYKFNRLGCYELKSKKIYMSEENI